MTDWRDDFAWAQPLDREAMRILAWATALDGWRVAEMSEDRAGFDLVREGQLRAGIRIRREGYAARYNDFTIRLSRPSGAVTEYQKILNSVQHVMVYGFAPDLARVAVIDFRGRLYELACFKAAAKLKRNGDGSADFFPIEMTHARQAGMVRYERGWQ